MVSKVCITLIYLTSPLLMNMQFVPVFLLYQQYELNILVCISLCICVECLVRYRNGMVGSLGQIVFKLNNYFQAVFQKCIIKIFAHQKVAESPISLHPCITLLNICQADKQIIFNVTIPEVYYSLYTYSLPAAIVAGLLRNIGVAEWTYSFSFISTGIEFQPELFQVFSLIGSDSMVIGLPGKRSW